MVGGNNCSPVNISTWPILDRDNFVDICTIEVPADFDESCLNKQFFDLIDWPHQAASENDVGFIIGFPGQHRSGEERSVITRILPICDFVTDVGPRKFTIADEHNERQVLLDLAKLGVPETYGGMSGSPVFRLREMGRPDFIGVFTSGSDGINAAFFCSHANFIASDGRLDHRRIPPR